MKYLLIPVTFAIWFLITYFGIYLCAIGMWFMFSLIWGYTISMFFFLVGIAYVISVTLEPILRGFIEKLYGKNWIIIIIHSIAGVLGIIKILTFIASYPPILGSGNFLKVMWDTAPFKTLICAIPFFVITVKIMWTTTIASFFPESESDEIQNT